MGRFGRGAARSMVARMSAHAVRATARPLIFLSGELKSYDNTTGMVVVTVYTGTTAQDIGPMVYYRPWAGNGYGDEVGLEKGMHIAVLCVDREGHDYVAFGATFDADHATMGAGNGERWIQDKLGSFVKWLSDSTLRLFGAKTAILYGGTNTVLGATSTDSAQDAVATKRYVDAALSAQMAQLKQDLSTWALASLAAGAGATGPTTLTAIKSQGSSKVTAAP